ncbi:hypothetical protein GCM10023209_30820 [Roseibacterium beibuensis]|uniref:Uncharacterized protein n=1 Tax=[Roseibacterium] beibuensis TaxID=1193142 RepID=A0ABP9LM55_9RHOB
MFGVMGDDPARLLAAMLQRVQAKGHEIGGIGHADHAEDAALLAEFVVADRFERVAGKLGLGHRCAPVLAGAGAIPAGLVPRGFIYAVRRRLSPTLLRDRHIRAT